jgi:alkanesulfonate monooxygenase SsuD/methylene tetrahydromethanopterin reductase-like flavin-dependent oxidoreductase (luciferase family)
VFVRLPVVLDEPEDLVRFMGRRLLTGYAIVPAYNASLARQGFEQEARAIATAWAAGERDRAAELFSDDLFDRFFLHGDAAACLARIDEYRAAGVTTPTLMPLSLAGSAEERAAHLEHLVDALAPAPPP